MHKNKNNKLKLEEHNLTTTTTQMVLKHAYEQQSGKQATSNGFTKVNIWNNYNNINWGIEKTTHSGTNENNSFSYL